MKKIVLTTLVMLAGSAAFADQCSYVSKSQAYKAKALLQNSSHKVKHFCEPCGDTEPTPVQVFTVKVVSVSDLEYEVLINDKNVDLAYTYVKGKNLAELVDCPAMGVSPELPK